jgi:CBS domain containing-hemolysin-like protein
MTPLLTILIVALSATVSLILATLTYSLRDFSRPRLADALDRAGRADKLDRTVDRASEYVFLTAFGRLIANMFILLGVLHQTKQWVPNEWGQYGAAILVTAVVALLFSVLVPHSLARHVGEPIIARSVGLLEALYAVLRPFLKLMHATDRIVQSAAAAPADEQQEKREEELQEELLSVVEEGAKEGVVDSEEREMIESVIEFSDHTVADAMTTYAEVVALPADVTLDEARKMIEESGHSRIPIYEDSLDHVVGVLYARDLIQWVGTPVDGFDVKQVMRKPLIVIESKPLPDLLRDFRVSKVHIAIVVNEYGGTAGLITIEDVLEELVGDISDEHEPEEAALFHKIDSHAFDVDARLPVDDFVRLTGIAMPEERDFDTIAGFVSTTMGRIPTAGTEFEYAGARFSVVDAEPHRVNRVKVELLPTEPEPTPEEAKAEKADVEAA